MSLSSFKAGRTVHSPPARRALGHRALPTGLPDIIIIIMLTMAAPSAVLSQEARLVNAQTQNRAVTSGLEKEFRSLVKNQVEPAWIGYAVAAVEGNHHICCYSSEDRHAPASFRHGRCRLEGRDDGMNFQTIRESDEGERADYLLLLFRVADKSVGKHLVFSAVFEHYSGGF